MSDHQRRLVTASMVAGAALLAAMAVLPAAPADAATVVVREADKTEAAPERRAFVMTDTKGRMFTDQDMLGSFALIYFGYTSCPDVCPTSLQTVAMALDELGDDADRLKAIFVSVDPERDTPEVMRQYISMFDERIIGLTGPKPFIDSMVAAYNVKYEIGEIDPERPKDYLVDHSASIAFVGPDGKLITRFGYGMTSEQIAERIRDIISKTTVN
ncbi:SCO family protein [Rhodobium gokarnense]|uniref:Protein SCO1/2 n=1 Tax=Rhodobium gokarnense TaxID=364296 RepID=A0ABT3H7V5_9HYPH|nr:SCO family protein [Rhodobium gokarnense]MCW2306478.1 protein SCO1/2 [Rhodobium gokarnense]